MDAAHRPDASGTPPARQPHPPGGSEPGASEGANAARTGESSAGGNIQPGETPQGPSSDPMPGEPVPNAGPLLREPSPLARDSPQMERRLAAVVFADVAGFSKLMELDDVRTTLRWKALRQDLLEPKIAEHQGLLLQVVGDSLFVEFRSAVEAVRWAYDVQRGIAQLQHVDGAETLQLRIGVNVEDVIVDGADRHGDGVNIAARIQQLAKPGETLVTGAVYEYVWNKLGLGLSDLGEHELRNIRRPVRVYRLDQEAGAEGVPARPSRT